MNKGQVSRADVKSVIEHLATVGHKVLKDSSEFALPGFAKFSVAVKPATEARMGSIPLRRSRCSSQQNQPVALELLVHCAENGHMAKVHEVFDRPRG